MQHFFFDQFQQLACSFSPREQRLVSQEVASGRSTVEEDETTDPKGIESEKGDEGSTTEQAGVESEEGGKDSAEVAEQGEIIEKTKKLTPEQVQAGILKTLKGLYTLIDQLAKSLALLPGEEAIVQLREGFKAQIDALEESFQEELRQVTATAEQAGRRVIEGCRHEVGEIQTEFEATVVRVEGNYTQTSRPPSWPVSSPPSTARRAAPVSRAPRQPAPSPQPADHSLPQSPAPRRYSSIPEPRRAELPVDSRDTWEKVRQEDETERVGKLLRTSEFLHLLMDHDPDFFVDMESSLSDTIYAGPGFRELLKQRSIGQNQPFQEIFGRYTGDIEIENPKSFFWTFYNNNPRFREEVVREALRDREIVAAFLATAEDEGPVHATVEGYLMSKNARLREIAAENEGIRNLSGIGLGDSSDENQAALSDAVAETAAPPDAREGNEVAAEKPLDAKELAIALNVTDFRQPQGLIAALLQEAPGSFESLRALPPEQLVWLAQPETQNHHAQSAFIRAVAPIFRQDHYSTPAQRTASSDEFRQALAQRLSTDPRFREEALAAALQEPDVVKGILRKMHPDDHQKLADDMLPQVQAAAAQEDSKIMKLIRPKQ